MAEPSVSQKFDVLCEITRAQHFAWRQALVEQCPGVDATGVVIAMWKVTGEQTARAYLKRLDRAQPIAPQVAGSIVWSSRCMGEDASLEPGATPEEAFVRHRACPWQKWHEQSGLVAEDRPGCDEWFRSTCATVAEATGRTVRFETLETLPDGGGSCLRRIWVEK